MAGLAAQPIQSIDVGSMFLMDLAVNESELNCANSSFSNNNDDTVATTDEETIFQDSDSSHERLTTVAPREARLAVDCQPPDALAASQQIAQDDQSTDYIISYVHNQRGNYCRLLKNIQGCYLNDLYSNPWDAKPRRVLNLEPQAPPKPERVENRSSTSSSLSDLSLTASSVNDSSVGSVISYTVISKYGDDGRASSSTRDEDSGILGMKNLDNQQGSPFNIDDYQQQFYKEKPIFEDTEIDPISDSARIHLNGSSYIERDNNKPTNNSHYHNKYSYRRGDSKRPMSASLPIQVPPRQPDRDFKNSCETAEANDFEEFLNLEYNRFHCY